MANLTDIYGQLSSVKDASVDIALAAALPTADDDALGWMVPMMLQRRHPEALRALVEHYHLLPDKLMRKVIEQVVCFASVLREAAGRSEGLGALNAVEMIRRAQATDFAYLVAGRLRIGPSQLRKAAGVCLIELAEATRTPPGEEAVCNGREAWKVRTAIEEAVTRYRYHQSKRALEALLMTAGRPWPIAGPYLDRPMLPGVRALRAMATRADSKDVQRALIPLLALSALTPAAIAGIRNCAAGGEFDEVISQAHLLILKRFRQPLRQAVGLDQMVTQHSGMDKRAAVSIVRWWSAVTEGGGTLVDRMDRVSETPDRRARLMALRRLMTEDSRCGDETVKQVIGKFCFDKERAIVRIALRYLLAAGWSGVDRLLVRLIGSTDKVVRQLARGTMASHGLDGLWRNWTRLNRSGDGRRTGRCFAWMAGSSIDFVNGSRVPQAVSISRWSR